MPIGNKKDLRHVLSADIPRLVFKRKTSWEENITKPKSDYCKAKILTKIFTTIEGKSKAIRICEKCKEVVDGG